MAGPEIRTQIIRFVKDYNPALEVEFTDLEDLLYALGGKAKVFDIELGDYEEYDELTLDDVLEKLDSFLYQHEVVGDTEDWGILIVNVDYDEDGVPMIDFEFSN